MSPDFNQSNVVLYILESIWLDKMAHRKYITNWQNMRAREHV